MYKRLLTFLLVIVMAFSCSATAFAATSWDAPNGGVWTLKKYSGPTNLFPGYQMPQKITYLTYDQVAALQSSNLTKKDLSTLLAIVKDGGIAAAEKWLVKKLGKKAAGRVIPYLGGALLINDVLQAEIALVEDSIYDDCVQKKTGAKIVEGLNMSLQGASNYKTIYKWTGTTVKNPDNCTGKFKATE